MRRPHTIQKWYAPEKPTNRPEDKSVLQRIQIDVILGDVPTNGEANNVFARLWI